jgi:hypothetical protein
MIVLLDFLYGIVLGVCMTIAIWERFKKQSRNIDIDVKVNSKQALKDLKEMELAMQKFKKENNLI